jgi:hypothetical protein
MTVAKATKKTDGKAFPKNASGSAGKASKEISAFKADRLAGKAVQKAKEQGSGATVGKDGKVAKSADPLKKARADKRATNKAVAGVSLKDANDKQDVKIDAAREKIVDRKIEKLSKSPGWNPSDPRRQKLQKLTARKARIDARQARRAAANPNDPADPADPNEPVVDTEMEATIARAKAELDFALRNAFPNQSDRDALVGIVTGAIRNRTIYPGTETFMDQAWALLEPTAQYQQRFPGLVKRSATGHAKMTPDQYMLMEDMYDQALYGAQIPSDVMDKRATVAKLVENDVTVQEMQQRVDLAEEAATRSPSFMKKFLEYRGMTPGHLIAFYLDPDLTGPAIAKQQRQFEVGAMMDEFGMRGAKQTAEFLEGMGMSDSEVGSTLDRASRQRSFSSGFGGRVDEDTRVKGAAGIGDAADAVSKVEAQRKARFNSTGGAAESNQGVVGLGSASR